MAKKLKIDGLLKKASEAVSRRNYDLAIFNYIQALQMQPDNVDARLALRTVQNRKAQENGSPKWKAFLSVLMANIHKMLKKNDQAIIDCENGLTADPSSLKLQLMLADLLKDEDYIEAAIWQRESISEKTAPDNLDNLYSLADLYHKCNRGPEAIATLERIKQIDSSADVDAMIREASANISSKIFQQGARDGSQSIVANAEETERMEMDANKLRNDEQRRKAINFRLDKDLKERPDDYAIWINIGDIAAQLDDFSTGFDEANKYYAKALELNPTNSSIKDKIGDLQIKKNRHTLQLLQGKVKQGDEAAKAEFSELRKKDLEYQLGEFERRVKDQPLKAEFHNRLGTIYMQFGRYDDAIAELQQAAKDPKYKIAALTNLGICMDKEGNPKMAINQFQKAREGIEVFEKFREPMYYEACAYYNLGNKEETKDMAALKKALELFTTIYEVDINFKDVKNKVNELHEIVKD